MTSVRQQVTTSRVLYREKIGESGYIEFRLMTDGRFNESERIARQPKPGETIKDLTHEREVTADTVAWSIAYRRRTIDGNAVVPGDLCPELSQVAEASHSRFWGPLFTQRLWDMRARLRQTAPMERENGWETFVAAILNLGKSEASSVAAALEA